MDKNLLVVIRQAGTANSFVPVIKQLGKKGVNIGILCYRSHNASRILKENEIPFQEVNSFEEALPILETLPRPDLLLTGTSEVVDDEIKYWAWSREKKIETWAYVDQWIFFWQRFTNPVDSQKFNHVPSKILVIDNYSRERLMDYGCPSPIIEVVGNPAFDELILFSNKNQRPMKASDQVKNVLFAGEPFGLGYPQSSFTEFTAMEAIAGALARLKKEQNIKVALNVRPHPLDNTKELKLFVSQLASKFPVEINFQLIGKLEALADADIVLGIESVLVFEGYLMGKTCACFIPDFLAPNEYTKVTDSIPVLKDQEALENFLRSAVSEGALKGKNQKRSTDLWQLSTEPFVKKIIGFLKRKD